MKKLFYLLALALIGAMVMFSAGCSDDDDDTETLKDQISGKWFKLFGDPINGPNGVSCNALFFDFKDDGDFKILSFLNGDPAAGHKGTYTFAADTLIIDITDDWKKYDNSQEPYYNWDIAPYIDSVQVDFNSDGSALSVAPEGEETWQVNKIELSDHEDGLVGMWEDEDGGVMNINAQGELNYELGNIIQSGSLQQFTYVSGDSYILVNLTFDSYDAGGECDYYIIEKFELDDTGDVLTIWHGDEEYEVTRMAEE